MKIRHIVLICLFLSTICPAYAQDYLIPRRDNNESIGSRTRRYKDSHIVKMYTDEIVAGRDGDILLDPDNLTGDLIFIYGTWPDTDGSDADFLKTNGDGTLYWGNAPSESTWVEFSGSISVADDIWTTNSHHSGYIDLLEISTPATPPANVLRLYVEEFKGFSFFNYLDSGGMNRKLVRDSFFAVKNNTGSAIPIGRAVYADGSSDSVPSVAPANASSEATMPAIGITIEEIDDGAHGRIMQVGLLEHFNTSAWSEGDILYVSALNDGYLVNYTPTAPSIKQQIGTVLVSGVGNGAIQCVARSAFSYGIADNNTVQIDDADAADNDYAKFTSTGLEGRSYAELAVDIGGSFGSITASDTVTTNFIRIISGATDGYYLQSDGSGRATWVEGLVAGDHATTHEPGGGDAFTALDSTSFKDGSLSGADLVSPLWYTGSFISVTNDIYSGSLTTTGDATIKGIVYTDEIRARDGTGLKIYDDGGNAGLFIEDGGRIGINQANPTNRLDIYVDNGDAMKGLTVTNIDVSNNPTTAEFINNTTSNGLFVDQNGNGVAVNIDNDGTANSFVIQGTTATDVIVTKAGDVGIGATPSGIYDLEAVGHIASLSDIYATNSYNTGNVTGAWKGDTVTVPYGGTGQVSLTNGGVLIGNGTVGIAATAVLNNGELLIGDGNTDPTVATLTAGEGIDITNGAGSITILGENASTTNKGIASFNSAHFTVSSGAISAAVGIADDNIAQIDHAGAPGVIDNDYAKFTASGLEGRSYTEVKSDLSLSNVENTALSTWTGSSNITTIGTITNSITTTSDIYATNYHGTGRIYLPNTTYANLNGIIMKNNIHFLHDFNYGDNGTVTTLGYNVFLGYQSGLFTMGSTATQVYHASYNTIVGGDAAKAATTMYMNSGIGYQTFNDATTGYRNSSLGAYTLDYLTTGHNNVAVGFGAGHTVVVGGGNTNPIDAIYIGRDAQALDDNQTNEIVIGANADGRGSNTAVLGNDSITHTYLKGHVSTPSDIYATNFHATADVNADGDVNAGDDVIAGDNVVVPANTGFIMLEGEAGDTYIKFNSAGGPQIEFYIDGVLEGHLDAAAGWVQD